MELAERSGVSIASITYLERAESVDPTLDALHRISRALDVPIRLLLDDPVYEGAEAVTQHLPPELLQFIGDPANLPFLRLARQLAEQQGHGLLQAAQVLQEVAVAQEQSLEARQPGTRVFSFGPKPASGSR